MIGQYLSQTNESATVAKTKKFFQTEQGLSANLTWKLQRIFPRVTSLGLLPDLEVMEMTVVETKQAGACCLAYWLFAGFGVLPCLQTGVFFWGAKLVGRDKRAEFRSNIPTVCVLYRWRVCIHPISIHTKRNHQKKTAMWPATAAIENCHYVFF